LVRAVEKFDTQLIGIVSSPPTMNEAIEELKRRLAAKRDLPPPAVRRALREERGLSQADVARAVGVSRQAVSAWEAGKRKPRGERLDAYTAVIRALKE
jgi:DNA-binding transcriptional regulator YiaG